MLFGYTAAIIAGFLLTAVSNWTKRETLVGAPLLALAALWLVGRVLLLAPLAVPAVAVAIVDVLFVPALAAALARPIIQSRNWRNAVMIALLLGFAVANATTHLDALGVLPGWGRRATFGALHLVVLLMLLITGRVVPMFTRNTTHDERIRSLPVLDKLAVLGMLSVTLSDLAWGDARTTPALSAITGLIALARARAWGTRKAAKEPMLWILHLGHAFIGVGLLLKACVPLWPVLASSATHALTVGAVGCLTIGMMVRVSLGHTGRPITTSRAALLAFLSMAAASVVRVLAPALPVAYLPLLNVSGALWTASFAAFLWQFMPVLAAPRADGKPG
jgi:uncharacterized protein involved in response to NO